MNMWYVEGKFPWGIERYEMLTCEQSREIHRKMSTSGGGWLSIMVKSGIMEGSPRCLKYKKE